MKNKNLPKNVEAEKVNEKQNSTITEDSNRRVRSSEPKRTNAQIVEILKNEEEDENDQVPTRDKPRLKRFLKFNDLTSVAILYNLAIVYNGVQIYKIFIFEIRFTKLRSFHIGMYTFHHVDFA